MKAKRKIKRTIYNVEETGEKLPETNKTVKPVPNVKLKVDTASLYGGSSSTTNFPQLGNSAKKSQRLPNIKTMEKEVLQYIIGQNTQVRQIITAIYRAEYLKTIKSNVLVIGNSGTGKTATIKEIARRLHKPYTIEDATKYTKEGYYGADVNDMILNLIENADNDLKKAENGIIVIDEIDKKAGHEENDVSGTEVLKSLLKIIEGTKIKVPANGEDPFDEKVVDFDTKNIIIIFLGAFSGLEKIRDNRLNSHPLGFATSKPKEANTQQSKFLKQDLVAYGMPEEFVGRIDTIIEMNKLSKEDLTLILRKSKLSIFKRYKDELKKLGVTISCDSKLYELIAEESMALDTGARELSNTVNYIFENIIYDILSNPKRFKTCKLSLDIVKDNTKYELA